jgi:hypothetical protein
LRDPGTETANASSSTTSSMLPWISGPITEKYRLTGDPGWSQRTNMHSQSPAFCGSLAHPWTARFCSPGSLAEVQGAACACPIEGRQTHPTTRLNAMSFISCTPAVRVVDHAALDRAPEAQARVSNVATLQTLVSTSLILGLVDCSFDTPTPEQTRNRANGREKAGPFLTIGPDPIAPHARGLRLADPADKTD